MIAPSRYLSLAEIAKIYEQPQSTLRRLASTDRWERTEDGRRPVLYLRTDVSATMARVRHRTRHQRAKLDARDQSEQ